MGVYINCETKALLNKRMMLDDGNVEWGMYIMMSSVNPSGRNNSPKIDQMVVTVRGIRKKACLLLIINL